MINFELFEDGNVKNYIMKFEDAVKKIPILNFNETSIELPNMVILTKEDKGFFSSLLNPSVDIFKVEDAQFEEMLKVVKKEADDIVFVDRNIKPKTTSRINLERMKDKQVFFKEYENSFATNETLFTTNFSEFQGVSMFTSRRHTFLVTEEDFVKIKEYLKK